MDFNLSETQSAISTLAAEVVGNAEVAPFPLGDVPQSRFDESGWGRLAQAGLLGVGLSEESGGGGEGLVGCCLVIERIGQRAASLPLWAGAVVGAAIDRHGSQDAKDRWLTPYLEGKALLSHAPGSFHMAAAIQGPGLRFTPEGERVRLDGRLSLVPIADRSQAVASLASNGDEVGLVILDQTRGGIDLHPQTVTNNDIEFDVLCDGAHGVLLCTGDAAVATARRLADYATICLCAAQTGLTAGALRLTAAYLAERHQFGRPLATMQAVQQRLVDAYIGAEAIRWTMWCAALKGDRGDAQAEVAIAAATAIENAAQVLTAAQHLHGGIGVDLSYDLAKYYLESKRVELALGPAGEWLERLGDYEVECVNNRTTVLTIGPQFKGVMIP
jgi:alkylation response protein AidB-like acyl-CoA dehydrogenase